MYDLEKIGKIIADTEHYFLDLDKLKIESSKMSRERFYSLSMLLFALLNRGIDLAQEIIRERKLGMPTSYREIFQILEKDKLIPVPLSKELQYLVSQRNVLAHEYFNITEQTIYSIFRRIKAIKDFIKIVRALVSSAKH